MDESTEQVTCSNNKT